MNIVLFLSLVLFWGSAYLAIHYVVEVYPPFLGAALRVGGATIIIAMIAWKKLQTSSPGCSVIVRCALSGLFFMGTAWALLFWGQQYIAPSVAAILIAGTPIMTALLLPVIERGVRVDSKQWLGILLGFLGILLVFSPQLGRDSTAELRGLSAVIGCVVSYGIALSMLQGITKIVSGKVLFVWQGIAAFLFLTLLSVACESWPSIDGILGAARANYALVFLIVFPTAIAFVICHHLIRVWGSVALSLVTFCIPLLALAIDAIALRYVPEWPVLVGAVVILGGIYRVHRV